MRQESIPTTNRKALLINLDQAKYGVLAEIGAGQEVARYFFKVGGAAGTVAMSISAYDMAFSDVVYGKSKRYVSSERLSQMLKHEYEKLPNRLTDEKNAASTYFAFADTVSARNYHGTNECHGWMGVRFQKTPLSEPMNIRIHVRMMDKTNLGQQDALGIIGINLIYGAFEYSNDPDKFIRSLADNIGTDRIEVDMIEFDGNLFSGIDKRVLSLKLIEHKLSNAVLFDHNGIIQQPSEFFYKKGIFIERGSFRPVTKVNIDMLERAKFQFYNDHNINQETAKVVFEMNMRKLTIEDSQIDYDDFLARVEVINSLGYNVLVSDYFVFHRLIAYLRRYSKHSLGLVLGINNLLELFNEEYYKDLEGGILEGFGRLFKGDITIYGYPMGNQSLAHYKEIQKSPMLDKIPDAPNKIDYLITVDNLRVNEHQQPLYEYLYKNHWILPVLGYDEKLMKIFSRDLLQKIKNNDSSWEDLVPKPVAKAIKDRHLWGYNS